MKKLLIGMSFIFIAPSIESMNLTKVLNNKKIYSFLKHSCSIKKYTFSPKKKFNILHNSPIFFYLGDLNQHERICFLEDVKNILASWTCPQDREYLRHFFGQSEVIHEYLLEKEEEDQRYLQDDSEQECSNYDYENLH